MKKIPFSNGTLYGIIKKMEAKVKAMKPEDRYCGVILDELYIQARREYDSSKGGFIGHPTVNPSEATKARWERNGETQMDRLATHALAAMVVGIGSHWKQLIGYEYTDSTWSADVVKNWIEELIRCLQGIGLKVYFIGLDMGPLNQAL